MSLPETIQQFLNDSPISLVAGSGGPLSKSEIKEFYDSGIAPNVINKKYGQICYAGLLMAQDYIWEAHEIVQDYPETESSWWHAFMHRMEGDYGNSEYWYRRVGTPGEYSVLTEEVSSLTLPSELSDLQGSQWDPFSFNGFIQKFRGTAINGDLERVHRLECSLLLETCLLKSR
jgi:hypothetical protein